MKTTKKKSINQLEKYSAIFMQLGLVLTLFIVFVSLEHQTPKKELISSKNFEIDEYKYPEFDSSLISIDKDDIKKKTKKLKIVIKCFGDINEVENKDIETIIDVKPIEEQDVNFIDNLKTFEDPIEPIENEIPFLIIEDAPLFFGCKNLSKEDGKKCFSKQMAKFVQKNFNSELAQDLGLKQGKHKIYAQFLIDKIGLVKEIKIRAPHKRLEKEVYRLINKLPQFVPGKQRGKPVKVRYTLPIAFQVH